MFFSNYQAAYIFVPKINIFDSPAVLKKFKMSLHSSDFTKHFYKNVFKRNEEKYITLTIRASCLVRPDRG